MATLEEAKQHCLDRIQNTVDGHEAAGFAKAYDLLCGPRYELIPSVGEHSDMNLDQSEQQ